jgi:protein TonB
MSEKKNKQFVKKPFYKGGSLAFNKFIADNIKYPEEALKNNIEGTVLLRYSINYKGVVEDVKVIKSLGYGCDKEAIRLIKLLKFEVPKEPRKLKVLFNKETKMFFKLPAKKKDQTNVSYTLSSKKNNENDTDSQGTGYSYTVEW